jgi:dUTP pyrophosphatase
MRIKDVRKEQAMKGQYSSMYPTVEVKRLDPDAPMPQFARDGDAGCDLTTMDEVEIAPQGTVMVHSGISVAIPRGFEGTLRPRSGMAAKRGVTLANAPSTIDSNYRGEIMIPLYNQGHETVVVKAGERVCQLLIKLQPEPQFVEVDEFTERDTNRGTGSFGSSGYGRL